MFTKTLDTYCFINTKCTFKMAGYFPTFAILSWLIQTACFQLDGKEDDQKGGRSTVNIIFAVHSRVCFWKNRVNLEEHFYNTINCILTLQVWKSRCNFNFQNFYTRTTITPRWTKVFHIMSWPVGNRVKDLIFFLSLLHFQFKGLPPHYNR